MIVVFDVDGTLIGGEPTDWVCFQDAFSEVGGAKLTRRFFEEMEDVTAAAVARKAFSSIPRDEALDLEQRVALAFLENLKSAYLADGSVFRPTEGAIELLNRVRSNHSIDVAIATGDWRESIVFKLQCAGVDVSDFPMATSSDRVSRSEIIRLAVSRAGRELSDALYIGDGRWDLHACRLLGIPFIGVGARHESLAALGAEHVCPNLSCNTVSERIFGE